MGVLALFLSLTPAFSEEVASSVIATNTFVAKAQAAYVYSVVAYNSSITDYYLLVFDSATAPTAGTQPTLAPVKIPAGSTGSITDLRGLTFTRGVSVACSTTDRAFTNGGNNFMFHANIRQVQ